MADKEKIEYSKKLGYINKNEDYSGPTLPQHIKLPNSTLIGIYATSLAGLLGGSCASPRESYKFTPSRRQALCDRLATWERVRLALEGQGNPKVYRAVCDVVERTEAALDAALVDGDMGDIFTSASSARQRAKCGFVSPPVTFGANLRLPTLARIELSDALLDKYRSIATYDFPIREDLKHGLYFGDSE